MQYIKKGYNTMKGENNPSKRLEVRKKISAFHKGKRKTKEQVKKRNRTRKKNGWFKNIKKTKKKICL
jgi:hypothetical protein